jgi:CRP-like cAMP-binding protein
MMSPNNKSAEPTSCANCPLRELAAFRKFTPEELKFVSTLKSGEFRADPGTSILLEGQSSPHLYTVLSGWAFRYKTLPDGRRQILNFALPGDFLGLQTAVFKEMDHSVEALSPMVLCVFPRQKMWSLFEGHAGLAFDLTWIASREERMLDEQLLSVGRRSAMERMAYVLVYIANRASILKLGTPRHGVSLPFTQQHLADALGLSLVHTNKTIRRLTDRGLIAWKNGSFKLLDEEALRTIAGYDTREGVARPII